MYSFFFIINSGDNMKKVIAWILVILWMILIFFLSDMTGEKSHSISEGTIENVVTDVVDTTNKLNITKKDKEQKKLIKDVSEVLNYIVRKILHVFEYFMLYILLLNAFDKYNIKNKNIIIISVIICFIYSCSDEFHQLFRERTGHFSDCIIDMIGVYVGYKYSNKVFKKK